MEQLAQVLQESYSWKLVAVWAVATLAALGITQIFLDTERRLRASKGNRPKSPWWPAILRGISSITGTAFGLVTDVCVDLLPTPVQHKVAEAAEASVAATVATCDHVSTLPFSTLVGFLSGLFLTVSLALLKARAKGINPALADKIPNLDETMPMTVSEEDLKKIIGDKGKDVDPGEVS